jgi:hypothetical protein
MRIKPSYPVLRRDHPLVDGLALSLPFTSQAGPPFSLVDFQQSSFNGSPAWGFGPYGSSLNCPGASGVNTQVLGIGNSTPFSIDLAFTFSGRTGNFPRIVWYGPGTSNQFTVGLNGLTNTVFASLQIDQNVAGPSLVTGSNYKIVVTHTGGTGPLKIYVDGVLFASESQSGVNLASGNFKLGYRDSSLHVDISLDSFNVWRKELSATQVSELHSDPFAMFRPRQRSYFYAGVGGGGPTYTITAESGSFSLTGIAANLTASRRLTADTASFSLAGQDAGLIASRRLTADAASFTLTGNDASLLTSRRITADAASFALTGIDAGLFASRVIAAAVGEFVLTGNDATLDYSGAVGPTYTLTAVSGSFALTGNDLTFEYTAGSMILQYYHYLGS